MPELEKLKIVYLISELGKGGSERQLYLLLTHMDLSQVEPLVVVFNPSTLASYQPGLQSAGIRVIEMPPKENTIIKRLIYLAGLLRQERPHVVHSWSVHNNPYTSIAGFYAQTPVRVGSMRDSLNNRGFQGLPWLMKKLAIHFTPRIFINAESIRKELIDIKFPAEKIILLENCAALLPPPTVTPGEAFGLPENLVNRTVVGTVCNFRKKKNIHIFVQGLAQIMLENDDLLGVLIGQPIPDEEDYYHSIKDLINHLGMGEKIFLLGFRNDAPALMHHFDIFCLLSDYEGTPNAVMEAMAAGVPVIATRVGGIPQLVKHEVCGLLIPPRDVESFKSALCYLLSEPQVAERMGIAGREIIQTTYGCTHRAEELLNIYRKLLLSEM